MELPDLRVMMVQAVGFVVLLAILWAFLFKPIRAILDARRNEIENDFSSAEANKEAAEQLRADYEQRLKAIEEEMRAKIAEAIHEGQAMREEIISDSRNQADRILVKAQEEIQRERDIALAELKTRVAELTVGAASKLIDEKLDEKKHHEMINKFIDDMESAAK